MITRVLNQTVIARSHIESQVRVRAPNESSAKKRAINRSVLHAGFSPAVLARDGVYTQTDARELKNFGVSNVWMVEVRLHGVV